MSSAAIRDPADQVMPRNRSAFTLIELLIVIAIIGVLAGLLLAGVAAIQQGAKRKRAAHEANAVVQAIKRYRTEYGKFPMQSYRDYKFSTTKDTTFNQDNMEQLRRVYVPLTNVTETCDENPRRILFLEVNPTFTTNGVYLDPWYNPYIIAMDENGDGNVQLTLPAGGVTTIVNQTVAVMSGGRDYKSGKQEVYSWQY